MRYLDVALMEHMCHRIAVAVFDTAEDPIAPFRERTLSLLDSALQLPRAAFGGVDMYVSLEEKTAALFYSLIKNHPFPNGNKRIAVAALLVFLYINDQWVGATPQEMYDLAIVVAASKPEDRQDVLVHVRVWLVARMERA